MGTSTSTRVGQQDGDVVGSDNTAIQTAIDSWAVQGGTVEIGPGTFEMGDSLHLRSGVTVRGAGAETVLRKAPMIESALSADLGYGHFDVSLAEAEKFDVGMGIHIADDRSGGFYNTCATLTWRDGDRFGVSRMLNHDYNRARNAIVRTVFPVISGYDLADATVENLTVDGNRSENGYLDGCRGGGVFLSQASNVTFKNVTVRDYNGDGISFQQTTDVLIEDCVCHDNKGHGLHPGSGSVRPIMRRVKCVNNEVDGIYYCLRVSFSLTEDCTLEGNGQDGISVGARDTDHVIRRNTVRNSGRHGIYFRQGDEARAGHRCLVEANVLEGNCAKEGMGGICIDGVTMDIHMKDNHVTTASREGQSASGIVVGAEASRIYSEGNEVAPSTTKVIEGKGSSDSIIHGPPPQPLRVGPDAAPADAARHLSRHEILRECT
jgi:hypothetical protein